MPQLLLEILSEEIPARMQAKAQADLERALMDRLTAGGVIPEGIKGFSGPRRLVAVVEGLPVKSADVVEDIQGPKEGAPEQAIQGFMKKAGLTDISQAHVHDVPKKGRIYVAHIRKTGRETASLIAEIVPAIIRDFHWPKSMRWGSGDLRWVRPINRILCTFDGEVVPFEVDGIKSDNWTEGHRVMGRGPYQVRRWDDYSDVLRNKGAVVLDRDERKEIILTDAKALCQAQNLELVEDIGLLEEVAGLAEHPVVVMGDMDKSFLDLPPEVIKLSMRTHQKYFAVRDPKRGGGLAPKFVVVANLDAADGGEKIAKGNARVLSARLNDARFFWQNDLNRRFNDDASKLSNIVFHERLGSVGAKVDRIVDLAEVVALPLHANSFLAHTAARLCKLDLVSDMVGEFPELQGVMGRYYQLARAGLDPQNPSRIANAVIAQKHGHAPADTIKIANAIRDHYKPQGPADSVPSDPTSVAVAIADKVDTLLGFWLMGEKPTGSKDPFALRRAALGVIRLLIENDLRLSLRNVFDAGFQSLLWQLCVSGRVIAFPVSEVAAQARQTPTPITFDPTVTERVLALQHRLPKFWSHCGDALFYWNEEPVWEKGVGAAPPEGYAQIVGFGWSDHGRGFEVLVRDLLAFFADRLKVHLREQGARHDLIDAVFALGEDDLVLIVKRVEALGAFLDTEDGKNLLAGGKRAANILAIEEKKDGVSYSGEADAKLLELPEEKALAAALAKAGPAASGALEKEDFAAAMKALAGLRGPVDAFFDKVKVNADDAAVRKNRLKLLSQIRDALGRVADFSKIEG